MKDITKAIDNAHQVIGLKISTVEEQLNEGKNNKKENLKYKKTKERYEALKFRLSAFNEKEAEKYFEKKQTEAANLAEEVRLFINENPDSRLEVQIKYIQTHRNLLIERKRQAKLKQEVQDDNSINKLHPVELQFNSKDITDLECNLKSLKEKCEKSFKDLKNEIETLEDKMPFFDEEKLKEDFKKLSAELKSDGDKESNEYKNKEDNLKALHKEWKNYLYLQNLNREKKACLDFINLEAVKIELCDYSKLLHLKKKLEDFDEQEKNKRKNLEEYLKKLKDQQEEIVLFLRKKFIESTDGFYGNIPAKKEKGKEKAKGSDMTKNTLSAIKSFSRLSILGGKILF